jgi:hypothetical protein
MTRLASRHLDIWHWAWWRGGVVAWWRGGVVGGKDHHRSAIVCSTTFVKLRSVSIW